MLACKQVYYHGLENFDFKKVNPPNVEGLKVRCKCGVLGRVTRELVSKYWGGFT